jgi:hypothetical protein
MTASCVSGAADAEHVPTLPVLQLNGGVVTLPVPTMLSDTVTSAGVLVPRRDSYRR